MSVFSGTFALAPDGPIPALDDPIAEARAKLRQAARIPFAAAKPEEWRSRFLQQALAARQALRDHISLASLPESLIARIERQSPDVSAVVERHRAEHVTISRQTDELVESARDAASIDIWQMIDLDEKAVLLEMALARHHNRLMQLACELKAGTELSA